MALALLQTFPSLLIYRSAWGPAIRLHHEESIKKPSIDARYSKIRTFRDLTTTPAPRPPYSLAFD